MADFDDVLWHWSGKVADKLVELRLQLRENQVERTRKSKTVELQIQDSRKCLDGGGQMDAENTWLKAD